VREGVEFDGGEGVALVFEGEVGEGAGGAGGAGEVPPGSPNEARRKRRSVGGDGLE
jgi:hypothetical protein